jgi:predicted glycosyltransferase
MKGKKVLIVPLNWGLGHASRIIPIISALKNAGATVIVGGSDKHQSLIKQEFRDILFIQIPHLNIRLNGKNRQLFRISIQLPAFLLSIIREHWALKKIIAENDIAAVISDNCYGLWNRKVYSIFITHQLTIRLPYPLKFLEKGINKINRLFIGNFNECWVPDIQENGGIAGELSHTTISMPNLKYIGILSRFNSQGSGIKPNHHSQPKKLLVIMSGPENQRTYFENKIKDEIIQLGNKYSYSIIRGLPEMTNDNLQEGWYNHLSAKQLGDLILKSNYIICRSGYSSIMDLLALGRTALLIPTPGQTEQEYLAEYLSEKGLFMYQKQAEINLTEGIRKLEELGENYESRIKTTLKIRSIRLEDLITNAN